MASNLHERASLVHRLAVIATLAVVTAFGGLTSARAQAGEGLYGPGSQTDTAFVRFVHADPTADPAEPLVDGIGYGPLEPFEVTPYRPLAEGVFALSLGGHDATLEATTGAFYTVALRPSGLLVLLDAEVEDPALARISLYNFGTGPTASLRTADGETDVVPDVEPDAFGTTQVNAADVTLAVFTDDAAVSLDDLVLERGEAFSVFVFGGDGDITVRHVRATLETN